jgi:hypothetical protein
MDVALLASSAEGDARQSVSGVEASPQGRKRRGHTRASASRARGLPRAHRFTRRCCRNAPGPVPPPAAQLAVGVGEVRNTWRTRHRRSLDNRRSRAGRPLITLGADSRLGTPAPARRVTVSRPVGGVLSSAEAPGWPSICAAYLGTLGGPPVPRLALLRVGFAEPPGSPRALVRSYRTVSPLPVRPR